MQPGASIARIAREHGVNANMVHYWRKLYREGRLGENNTDSVRLLPVTVSEAVPGPVLQVATALPATDFGYACIYSGCHPHRVSQDTFTSRERCRCCAVAYRAGDATAMMGLPPKTEIWIAAGVTDLRRGFDGLSALVQTKLEQHPFSGHVFVFRGRRGDLIKLLWWDGDGLCLFAKRLERGRFVWPQASGGCGGTQSSPAIDAAGRHRLAATGAYRRAAVSDLSSLCRFAQLFVRHGGRTKQS